MYDELVKRLRDAAKMSDALSVLLPHSGGNAVAKLHRDAADAIEELSNWWAQADKLIKMLETPRWISVEEALPKESERVLVACEDGVSFGFFEEIIADDEFVKEWHDMMYYPISVTHWMPLPEPPKEE